MATLDKLDVRIAALEAEIAGCWAERKATSDEALKARLLGIIEKRSEAYNILLREKASEDAAGIIS
jgi:hypothetical protein